MLGLGGLAVGGLLLAMKSGRFLIVVGADGRARPVPEEQASSLLKKGRVCVLKPSLTGLERSCRKGGPYYSPVD